MSKMSELAADIEELLVGTSMTKLEIAERLNIPVEWVDQVEDEINEFFNAQDIRAGFDGYVSENDYIDSFE
jgi:methyl coenzyme M reductase subunit C-like uncharacterized protein (methanogenesis marker protein 7)